MAKLDKVKAIAKAHKARDFKHTQGQQLRLMHLQMRPQPWRRAVRVMPVQARQMPALANQRKVPSKMAGAVSADDKFEQALHKFIGQAGLVGLKIPKLSRAVAPAKGWKSKAVKGNQKSMFDYNMDAEAEPH